MALGVLETIHKRGVYYYLMYDTGTTQKITVVVAGSHAYYSLA